MDQRIVEFIAALRNGGVRVSVAESTDAMRACEQIPLGERETFRAALQATLVKDQGDAGTFLDLFPRFFDSDSPPMMSPQNLSEEDRQRLEQALRQMTPQQLAQLLRMLLQQLNQQGQEGQPSQQDQISQMVREAMSQMRIGRNSNQRMINRVVQRELSMSELMEKLEELLEALRQQGMSEEQIQELRQTAEANLEALRKQIEREVGNETLRRQTGEPPQQPSFNELMDRPFEHMTRNEVEDLRKIVQRLAAQLRTRMALRQKRGSTGQLDAKGTIRKNMSYGGVPMEIKHRTRHLKPRLTILIDRSVSTEKITRFLLTLVYTLQDQISRTRSFAFIHDLFDISPYFQEHRVERAVEEVMNNVYPLRSYSTDLGTSLATLVRDHLGSIDHRTTVLILGDARNNENDPGLRYFEEICRRARRVVWFNPEEPDKWGCYDPGSLSSDMLAYQPLCSSVHYVSNMRQLIDAIDRLLTR